MTQNNKWYDGENKKALLLDRFYIIIHFLPKDYRMLVVDSSMDNRSLLFDSLDTAVSFAEDVIPKCIDLDEIEAAYVNGKDYKVLEITGNGKK